MNLANKKQITFEPDTSGWNWNVFANGSYVGRWPNKKMARRHIRLRTKLGIELSPGLLADDPDLDLGEWMHCHNWVSR
jgi:hypothetical protein